MIRSRHSGPSDSARLSESVGFGAFYLDPSPDDDSDDGCFQHFAFDELDREEFGLEESVFEESVFEELVGAEAFAEDELQELAVARALSQDGESAG